MTQRVLVAGIGNLFLGDDGFGCEVVRRLVEPGQDPLPRGVRVVDYGIRGMHLAYDLLDGYDALVLVDAIPGDGTPGVITSLKVGPEDLGHGEFDGHGMDPVAVLGSLEGLGGTLPPTYVVGCCPASVHEGIGLSAPVQAAMSTALHVVRALVAEVAAAPHRVRRRFEVSGVVQGVGFRPFVYVTASELALTGSVLNDAAGVVIEVEGDPAAVREFGRKLRSEPPPLAVVQAVHESDQEPQGGTGFTIGASTETGETRTLASPDVSMCADCLREMRDPADRRFRHPFITCTNCGPRFTIITRLPYDRSTTTMAGFEMCAACRSEYDDPADRRFHAQPIACPECGPRLRLVTSAERGGEQDGERALAGAREMLAGGSIVAVKGLGGYHLACDAANEVAVAELRRRKRRGDKPFAVMAADLPTVREMVAISPAEEELLTGVRRPIVLLARHGRAHQRVAHSVAPGNPDLGVMLPYTPVHALLFGTDGRASGPPILVMTSGNLSGEPLVTDDAEALVRLEPLADAWLCHDRPITVPCDDSVARFVTGLELPIRRSRGYAPLPIALPFEVDPTLAVGADLKNTCAVARGRYAWMSQHIGDMENASTLDALTSTERHLEQLTGVRPVQLVADQHPGYRSSVWATTHARGRPVRTVQHHHAHIASVMGEHGVAPHHPVIGFAFDGTGYGTDSAIWGGEVLVADYKGFRRFAHLGYVPLAGGDISVRRPYRMALSHLRSAGVTWDDDLPCVAACPPTERGVLAHQLETDFGCVPTSSMGRLFDAVASLTGIRHLADYEAEAAIELEGMARGAEANGCYHFVITRVGSVEEPCIADPGAVIRAVVDDLRADVALPIISARFHASVIRLVVELADMTRSMTGLDTVALGGGVFQNALLLDASFTALTGHGFTVLRPRLLPPNDGGIALGQILVGASG